MESLVSPIWPRLPAWQSDCGDSLTVSQLLPCRPCSPPTYRARRRRDSSRAAGQAQRRSELRPWLSARSEMQSDSRRAGSSSSRSYRDSNAGKHGGQEIFPGYQVCAREPGRRSQAVAGATAQPVPTCARDPPRCGLHRRRPTRGSLPLPSTATDREAVPAPRAAAARPHQPTGPLERKPEWRFRPAEGGSRHPCQSSGKPRLRRRPTSAMRPPPATIVGPCPEF